MTEELPSCNGCGENDWIEVNRKQTGRKSRRERIYVCSSCGREGKMFDKGKSGTVILTGAMRQ